MSGFFERKPAEVTRAKAERSQKDFTLIEFTIAALMLGFAASAMMTFQGSSESSKTRAQIAQIQTLKTAVHVFKEKYGYLPGDMPAKEAARNGLAPRLHCGTEADGDGFINALTIAAPYAQGSGAPDLFWQDLGADAVAGWKPRDNHGCLRGTALSAAPGENFIGYYLPPASLGHGTFLYGYSYEGHNWLGLSQVTRISEDGMMISNPGIPVIEAYSIDKKIDTAHPTSGDVRAIYLGGSLTAPVLAPHAASDAPELCYTTEFQRYALGALTLYGRQPNCGLSFRLDEK